MWVNIILNVVAALNARSVVLGEEANILSSPMKEASKETITQASPFPEEQNFLSKAMHQNDGMNDNQGITMDYTKIRGKRDTGENMKREVLVLFIIYLHILVLIVIFIQVTKYSTNCSI